MSLTVGRGPFARQRAGRFDFDPPAEAVEVHPQPSATRTECPYKGTARHWSAHVAGRLVDDVAWQYDREVRREAERVRGLYAFYDDRTRIEVDG